MRKFHKILTELSARHTDSGMVLSFHVFILHVRLFFRIHQVRSYGSNLAVNIWWKHHLTSDIEFDKCNDPCDREFTLAEVDFGGFTQTFSDPEEIRLV